MKKKLLLVCLIILISIISCSKKKSVIEQLDLNEVTSLIKQDSLYESVIQEVEKVRDVFEKDLVLKSKFKDFTYENYLTYHKMLSDSTFQKDMYIKVTKLYDSEMDTLLVKYKPTIDEKMLNYQTKVKQFSPKTFFKVKFSSIDKEYYSSMTDVKSVNVNFKITPLKGSIQGGSFRYKIIPKVTKRSVADGGCRFSSFTKKASIYSWEAPYDIEDEFKSKSTDSIKENYDFEYKILSVRVGGITYDSGSIDIPFSYKYYMDKDSLSTYEYSSIIEDEFGITPPSYIEILNKLISNKKQKIDKTAYDLEKLIDSISEWVLVLTIVSCDKKLHK